MDYMDVMKHDFPKDFADDDEFIASLLDLCETDTEVKDE